MKNLALLTIAILLCASGFSQKGNGTYDWGVGVKYYPAAISVKKYVKNGDALEGLFTKFDEGYRATLLLELCPNITMKKNLRLVLGPGIHVGVREKKYRAKSESNPAIGIGGIMGMEYKIPKIPFTVQADYQPSIDFIGDSENYPYWGGLTIRYTW